MGRIRVDDSEEVEGEQYVGWGRGEEVLGDQVPLQFRGTGLRPCMLGWRVRWAAGLVKSLQISNTVAAHLQNLKSCASTQTK